MWGILGIIAANIDKQLAEKATDTLSHRGMDDAVFFIDEGVGFSHRRLSNIDFERCHQHILNCLDYASKATYPGKR